MGNTLTLYHYTTEAGKNGIVQNGMIYQSTDYINDCLLGAGVYLTSLNPQLNFKEIIALNNYGEYYNVLNMLYYCNRTMHVSIII